VCERDRGECEMERKRGETYPVPSARISTCSIGSTGTSLSLSWCSCSSSIAWCSSSSSLLVTSSTYRGWLASYRGFCEFCCTDTTQTKQVEVSSWDLLRVARDVIDVPRRVGELPKGEEGVCV
jgi:hypothetical protein